MYMKKIQLLLFFSVLLSQAYPQKIDYDHLTPEFKDVATKAFEKVSSSTKQWFANMARQHPAGSFNPTWAGKKLNQKFGSKEMKQVNDLFILMMAYQRSSGNENIVQMNLAIKEKKPGIQDEDGKLKLDNDAIEKKMKEAEDQKDKAMNAAGTQQQVGVVSSVAGTSGTGKSSGTGEPIKLFHAEIVNKDTTLLKKKNAGIAAQAEEAEKEDKDAIEAARKHQKEVEDALKKLMDELSEIGRHVKA